jgi:hypothetical protein
VIKRKGYDKGTEKGIRLKFKGKRPWDNQNTMV